MIRSLNGVIVLTVFLWLVGVALAAPYTPPQPPTKTEAQARMRPEVWKLGLIGLAVAGFLIRKRL
jgi:hypothetical protein